MVALSQFCGWMLGRTLGAYLVRGALGIGLFATGFMIASEHPYLGLAAALLGLVPLGGCPTCWLGGTIGAACEWRPPQKPPAS